MIHSFRNLLRMLQVHRFHHHKFRWQNLSLVIVGPQRKASMDQPLEILPGKLLRTIRQVSKSLGGLIERKIFLTAIEFFLVDTCNLRCVNCVTNSPFMSDANLPSLESFVRSLSLLSRVVRCNELRFVGGEPLLNKEICQFMRAARKSKIFRDIRVITNGVLLHKMSEDFWRLADIVRISIYPATSDIFTEAKLASLKAIAYKHHTKLEIIRDTHFMKATSDRRIEDVNIVQRTFSTCGEAHGWSCHLLYRNCLYRCSRVHTLDRHLSQIGADHDNFTDMDGIVINDRKTLFADLMRYFKSSEPLKACSFCFGTSGPLTTHRQLSIQQVRSKCHGGGS